MNRRYRPARGFVNPTRLSWVVPLLVVPHFVLLCFLLLPDMLPAQGLPSYRPINPVAASRSGLGFEPFRPPVPGWRAELGVEYGSTIEDNSPPQGSYFLDSELLRIRASVSRDLGPDTFIFAEAEALGAYAGMFDGFLEWYHGLLGIDIPERDRRPRNDFLYATDLPGQAPVVRDPSDVFLGDVRLGAGFRIHPRVQSAVALTLPTNTGPAGYGRETVSLSLLNTVHLPVNPRLVFEGSLSAGYTPSQGALERWQHESFVAGSSGLRWRFWGRQSLYGNLFLHSPYYHDTTMPSLDRRDLSFDFGWILAERGERELRIGMTEDLEPGGPAVDLVLRIGGRM